MALPKVQWSPERFVVMGTAPDGHKSLTGLVSEGNAHEFIKSPSYRLVEEPEAMDAGGFTNADDQPDFSVEVTRDVLAELGVYIVEIVMIGKSGSPVKKQPAARFWIISISGNKVLSRHMSLRHAYAEVSAQYEAKMKRRPSPGASPPTR
ncbi:MAG: hypothetical protein ABL934_02180 [Lysobacteraceae bacterium]